MIGNKIKYVDSNELIEDEKFLALLKHDAKGIIGNLLGNKETLFDDLQETLSGPPEDLILQDNILISNACREHSCSEKGLFAIDLSTGYHAYAIIHFLDQNGKYVEDGQELFTLIHHDNLPFNFQKKYMTIAKTWAEKNNDEHKQIIEKTILLKN